MSKMKMKMGSTTSSAKRVRPRQNRYFFLSPMVSRMAIRTMLTVMAKLKTSMGLMKSNAVSATASSVKLYRMGRRIRYTINEMISEKMIV